MKLILLTIYSTVVLSAMGQQADTLSTQFSDSLIHQDLINECSYVSAGFSSSGISLPDSLKPKALAFEQLQRQFNFRDFLETASRHAYKFIGNYIDVNNIQACASPCGVCSFGCTRVVGSPELEIKYRFSVIFDPYGIAVAGAARGYNDLWMSKIILLHELEHLFGHDGIRRKYLESFENNRNAFQAEKKLASQELHASELRCDEFAAMYAAFNGASLEQILMAVKVMQPEKSSFGYPSLADRIARMTRGYNNGIKLKSDPLVSDLQKKMVAISEDIQRYNFAANRVNRLLFRRGGAASIYEDDDSPENNRINPYFMIDSQQLFYVNSIDKRIIIGKINPVMNFRNFKFVVRDEYFVSWYIDNNNNVHNQNDAIIGRIALVK